MLRTTRLYNTTHSLRIVGDSARAVYITINDSAGLNGDFVLSNSFYANSGGYDHKNGVAALPYETKPGYTGTAHVQYDATLKILSGTFSFKAHSDTDSTEVNITGGEFKMPYTP